MSTNEQQTSSIPTSVVRNTGEKNGPQNLEELASNEALRELCDKNYHQLLPLIAEKMQKEKERQDKLKAVKARLLYGNESGRNSRNHEESHYSESKTPTAQTEPKRRHGRNTAWKGKLIGKRRDVEFNIGDMVLVKLQPYRRVTLAKRYSNKLAKRYYGPFKVLECVGKVAYRLALLDSSQEQVANLMEDEHEGQPVEQPLAICDTRIVLQKGIPVRQVLVQWSGRPPDKAT
ncbi:hypothetical protein Tco_1045689 [Tanacetum coccineum]|uniref:Tf2-1-like SH3-like domain-containing protein n=1 Tax=Tanacetum coccineum TaxID=301880 RepID=A0ABQ5GUI2_9ASTR